MSVEELSAAITQENTSQDEYRNHSECRKLEGEKWKGLAAT